MYRNYNADARGAGRIRRQRLKVSDDAGLADYSQAIMTSRTMAQAAAAEYIPISPD